ncbi:hypothetical protein ACFFQW_33590 [Umezawaea endophytica]|uniref:Uncharacterized protein n=1 Tax=Umezawaea endophytica TaxID=1654476 RepID=A0A9X2VPW6_9PSEU|nr:hypothetical protein [Umezawaea endophytica]MCS7480506.1 hypothetical protein [Umezawaea endophytica]
MQPHRAIAGTAAAAALVVLLHLLGALDPRAAVADPPGVDAVVDGRFIR